MGFDSFDAEKDLPKLRSEIILNSLYVSDYENSFGFTARSVCDFFDGFMSFLEVIASEDMECPTIEQIFALDTTENLIDWYYCHEEFPFEEAV